MTTPDDIVAAARSWLGTPYQHQASVKGVGCDCLGLLRGVWRECVGAEPETAPAYSSDWAEASSEDQLLLAAQRHLVPVPGLAFQPGDVLLFRWRAHLPVKHVGVATGPATMVHAQDGHAVAEVHVERWWRRHLSFVFRFPDRVA
jgi:NlpC/P60 family putative phage cell wall peptidase